MEIWDWVFQLYYISKYYKYGWNNITHEVLFTDLTEDRAKNLEKDLIRHYKNLNISLNITDGGDMNFIAEFPSISYASKVTGLTLSRIAECCRGKTNKYKNYYWRYKDGK